MGVTAPHHSTAGGDSTRCGQYSAGNRPSVQACSRALRSAPDTTRYATRRSRNRPKQYFAISCEFLGVPYEAAVLVAGQSRTGVAASGKSKVTRNLRRADDYFSPAMIAQNGVRRRPPAGRARLSQRECQWRPESRSLAAAALAVHGRLAAISDPLVSTRSRRRAEKVALRNEPCSQCAKAEVDAMILCP